VGEDGGFQFGALAPGKYKLFAWERMEDVPWTEAEFQKRFEDRATEITAGAGETQKVQLRAILIEDMQ
jgi:hypothetical protein